ncbi:MAG: sugar ABC transporter substrate-binding protein [Dehalococcoidia bacterium]
MPGTTPPTIAVFTKNRINPAYAAARLGAARVAARYGARTVDYIPERPDNVEEQIALLEQAIRDRPDAIVLVPVHETAVDAAVRGVREAGIPVVNCVNRLGSPEDYACFVGSDDRALADEIAERLFAALGGRGDVVIIEGTPGAATARDRQRGFLDAAARYPDIRIVASRTGNYLQADAREAMTALLAAHATVDGVLAANDSMALGAIEALRAAGRTSVVVGANAIPEAITAIKDGSMLASADFDAYKMACVAAEATVRLLRGLPVPKEIMLPVEIVDATNYGPWELPIAERTRPPWDAVVTDDAYRVPIEDAVEPR